MLAQEASTQLREPRGFVDIGFDDARAERAARDIQVELDVLKAQVLLRQWVLTFVKRFFRREVEHGVAIEQAYSLRGRADHLDQIRRERLVLFGVDTHADEHAVERYDHRTIAARMRDAAHD